MTFKWKRVDLDQISEEEILHCAGDEMLEQVAQTGCG